MNSEELKARVDKLYWEIREKQGRLDVLEIQYMEQLSKENIAKYSVTKDQVLFNGTEGLPICGSIYELSYWVGVKDCSKSWAEFMGRVYSCKDLVACEDKLYLKPYMNAKDLE